MERLGIVCAFALALAACGGGPRPGEAPPAPPSTPAVPDAGAPEDAAAEAVAPLRWRDVDAASCGLRAKMPGDPKESSQTVSTDTGPMVLHVFMYEAEGGTSAMGMTCSEPKGRGKHASGITPERALRGGRDNIVSRLRGNLVREDDATVLGRPARDVVVQTPRGEIYARLIFYKKHGTVTTLLAIGYDEKEARTFFESVAAADGKAAAP